MNLSVLRVASCMAPNADDTCREITRFLGRQLAIRTEYVDHITWQERERLLDAGEIQLCWLCGLPYVWKADRTLPSIELVAAPVMTDARYGDQAIYYSDVVVHRESRYSVFGDLRGARWAYNESQSHSGYNVVLNHLYGLGETGGYFGNAVASGSHQISLDMIIDGQVDASAIDSTVLNAQLNRLPGLRSKIRIIDTLGPSPMPPWVMLKRLPIWMKRSIRDFFLDMAGNADGCKILETWGIARFAPVEDVDYDPIRMMARNTESVRLSASG